MAAAVMMTLYLLSEAGEALVVTVPVGSPDAIVSLASHDWERLPTAAALAHTYPRALVLLTEPAAPSRYNCHRCEARTGDLTSMGVEPARIRVLKLREGGTFGEALAVKEVASALGVRRLLVVTSPYHTRRSLGVFRSAAGETIDSIGVIPAASTPVAHPSRWWIHGYDRAYVAYEWAARAWYWPRHGVTFWE